MNKPMMLIINPKAGKGALRGTLVEMMEVFYKGGMLPTVYFTLSPGDGARLARDYGSDYELLVCLGGDGTLSDVISGLVTLKKKPRLGYIPMGTANDMATTLGLSRDPVKMAELILRGKTVKYDVGVLGDSGYFSYIAAFGAFTEVSYTTPQESKNALGHLAYLLEGMASLPKLTHYETTVEYEGGVIQQDLCFGGVTNSTSVAGLVRLDDSLVELGDGFFEIILIKMPRSVGDLNNILAGILSRNYNNEAVTFLQSRWVRFTFDRPVAWTRDGESGGTFTQVEITNLPGAVEITVG
jgi:diacylglycerol kinase (ATP)